MVHEHENLIEYPVLGRFYRHIAQTPHSVELQYNAGRIVLLYKGSEIFLVEILLVLKEFQLGM